MALFATHNESTFGVGDEVKIYLKVKDGEKVRSQIFAGMIIGIKGRDSGKSFTVRKMSGNIGVEMIFPLATPSLEKIEVTRHGVEGTKHAKLYYVRNKPSREIEKIYSRAAHKNVAPNIAKAKKIEKKETVKKVVKKASVKKVVSKK